MGRCSWLSVCIIQAENMSMLSRWLYSRHWYTETQCILREQCNGQGWPVLPTTCPAFSSSLDIKCILLSYMSVYETTFEKYIKINKIYQFSADYIIKSLRNVTVSKDSAQPCLCINRGHLWSPLIDLVTSSSPLASQDITSKACVIVILVIIYTQKHFS
jgi:hypothetical protein